MSQPERWTIGRLLQWTTDYLKKSGSTSARLDAEVLLAESRGCPRIQLYTAFDEEPAEAERTRFRELVKRRAAGEPVAYLVGHREFYSLPFQVTPAVLIPRPETEFVVIAVLDAVKEFFSGSGPSSQSESNPGSAETPRIADVGTGSGAIAVAVARHAPRCQVTAIDISPEALAVARGNAERNGVADRIEFIAGDLFAALPSDQRFDVVASNPPYVATSELELMASETRLHEPRVALVAGPSGLEVIARLVPAAADRLRSGGRLIFEISPMLVERTRECLEADGRYADIKWIRDLAGLPRVVDCRRR